MCVLRWSGSEVGRHPRPKPVRLVLHKLAWLPEELVGHLLSMQFPSPLLQSSEIELCPRAPGTLIFRRLLSCIYPRTVWKGAGSVEGHFVMCYEECLGLSPGPVLLCPHSLATSDKSLLAKTFEFPM